MHPGCGGEFCGVFFHPHMCTELWKFSEKSSINSLKFKSLIFQKFVPSNGKFTNFFVHLHILLTDTRAQRHQHNPTQMQKIFEWSCNLSGRGWLTLVKMMSPLLLHMTSLKYCQDFSAQAFGAWALKQIKAPHTVLPTEDKDPKLKFVPNLFSWNLAPKTALAQNPKLERNANNLGHEFWGWIFWGRLKPWRNKAGKFNRTFVCWRIHWEISGDSPKTRQTQIESSAQIRSAEPRDQQKQRFADGSTQYYCAASQRHTLPHNAAKHLMVWSAFPFAQDPVTEKSLHFTSEAVCQGAAKVDKKEFDHFFPFSGFFRSLFGHCFWCFCHFCRLFLPNSFAGLLLRQSDTIASEFVATVHSQEKSCTLFEIWWQNSLAIRIRIRSRIAETAVHSRWDRGALRLRYEVRSSPFSAWS